MSKWPNLIDPLYEEMKKDIKVYPSTANRASELGHECLRYLVYLRITKAEDLPRHDVHLQAIFNEGALHEDDLMIRFTKARLKPIEQQCELEWREYQIKGHVDCVFAKNGMAIPTDTKSMDPNIFRGIFPDAPRQYLWIEVEEKFQSKPWLKKYFAQIQLYMLFKNCEIGIFVFKNKSSGALAQVNLELDYDYTESLVKKAEAVNKHVKDETLPDRIPFKNDVCRRCKFADLCCPDMIAQSEFATVSDDELEAWCKDDLENTEAQRKKDKARKSLLAYMKANEFERCMVNCKYVLEMRNKRLKVFEVGDDS